MHTIRRQAKFAAWYNQPDDDPTYNPFRKVRKPSRSRVNPAHVVEGGGVLNSYRTAPPSAGPRAEDDLGGRSPRHADTYPISHSKHHSGMNKLHNIVIPQTESPNVEEADNEEKELGTTDASKVSVGSDTIAPEANDERAVANGVDKPRQRKNRGLKQLFHKNKEEKPEAEDGEKEKQVFTPMSQFKATVLNSWINILLVFSPIGIAIYYAHVNPIIVFVVNFIAIIPLAAMLSYATEEIAFRTGETIGGLLNASFGNAVELIVSIIALTQDQVLIVQTSLIGSMLSNLLLVMGMCFFFGGINRSKQEFNVTVAQTASSLLALAVGSLIIPTAFFTWTATSGQASIAPVSRGTSIMLLIVYGCYLFFQLKTHAATFNTPSGKNEKNNNLSKLNLKARLHRSNTSTPEHVSQNSNEQKDDDTEEPQLSVFVAILTLAISTVLVALNAEYLVDSINAITCSGGISKTFVGLILLPIVGNAAEHATAVTVAVKDKMDLAIGVAVGSSLQIALLVLPFTVVLGWIIGKNDMTLEFDGFQIAILFVAVLLVNYLIQDGESHWLEGVMLMTLYIIISIAAWFYPAKAGQSDCPAK